LLEDLGLAGDITSASVIPHDHRSTVVMAARQPGVIAGLDAAELAFTLVDPEIVMRRHLQDGDAVKPGDVIATIDGPSRGLLTAERTALNFLGHLSGIATVTAEIAAAISGTAKPPSPARARRRRGSGAGEICGAGRRRHEPPFRAL
jgi:nicotinate-nucleotide pyrophosphorylase (carboxylating)